MDLAARLCETSGKSFWALATGWLSPKRYRCCLALHSRGSPARHTRKVTNDDVMSSDWRESECLATSRARIHGLYPSGLWPVGIIEPVGSRRKIGFEATRVGLQMRPFQGVASEPCGRYFCGLGVKPRSPEQERHMSRSARHVSCRRHVNFCVKSGLATDPWQGCELFYTLCSLRAAFRPTLAITGICADRPAEAGRPYAATSCLCHPWINETSSLDAGTEPWGFGRHLRKSLRFT